MSNVLIGIIGVILFIGLALAGAMFLGPRFQESANNSRASASVQAVAQIASAATMFEVQEGRTAQHIETSTSSEQVNSLRQRGYLKAIPTNPTGGGPIGFELYPGELVTMELTGTNAEPICKSIQRQTTGLEAPLNARPEATSDVSPSGCYTNGTRYYAYSRI